MTGQKHIIWSSDPDYEDWRGDLEEQYPELSEQERMELMVEQNNDYLDDERCNLNIQLSRPILLIADIGRWDGRYPGYAEIKSGNIRDCLYSEMDYSTWYVDRLGDLRCRTSRRHEPLSLPCLQGECERSTDRPAERKAVQRHRHPRRCDPCDKAPGRRDRAGLRLAVSARPGSGARKIGGKRYVC